MQLDQLDAQQLRQMVRSLMGNAPPGVDLTRSR